MVLYIIGISFKGCPQILRTDCGTENYTFNPRYATTIMILSLEKGAIFMGDINPTRLDEKGCIDCVLLED